MKNLNFDELWQKNPQLDEWGQSYISIFVGSVIIDYIDNRFVWEPRVVKTRMVYMNNGWRVVESETNYHLLTKDYSRVYETYDGAKSWALNQIKSYTEDDMTKIENHVKNIWVKIDYTLQNPRKIIYTIKEMKE